MGTVIMSEEVESWGRFSKAQHRQIVTPEWAHQIADSVKSVEPYLAYGMGRSYGDVCLNDRHALVRMDRCSHLLSFDKASGVLRAEAGITIAQLLEVIVPSGWFIPVTPGTKYVTLGGAVANDIHGKNHHKVGTFGCHVRAFELLRSDRGSCVCSPTQHTDLFEATIGGMGLTGIITWVELQLIPITSRYINEQQLRAGSLQEVVELTEASDDDWEYTVSWIDVMATGNSLGRGIVLRGNFNIEHDGSLEAKPAKQRATIPFVAPSWLLSKPTIKAFNTLWYRKQLRSVIDRNIDYDPFFYPLDAIGSWNRLYGLRGMLQYQCVVPREGGIDVIRSIIRELQRGSASSFLAVVKTFGTARSPGLMSFPKPGITITLDMPNTGKGLLSALDRCDEIVSYVGGRVYAAKDARMSGTAFRMMYPAYETFASFVDPQVSSSFWRRIHAPHQ